MIVVSRIIHVKVDRRLNVTNKFKYQRRLLSRLAIVMFRGTPCTYLLDTWEVILHLPSRNVENILISSCSFSFSEISTPFSMIVIIPLFKLCEKKIFLITSLATGLARLRLSWFNLVTYSLPPTNLNQVFLSILSNPLTILKVLIMSALFLLSSSVCRLSSLSFYLYVDPFNPDTKETALIWTLSKTSQSAFVHGFQTQDFSWPLTKCS